MVKNSSNDEILLNNKQSITACALIHQSVDGIEKVLLLKRADTKKFLPSVFELLGGHIDYGENIVDGLKREVMEEIGMTVSVGDPFAAFTYVNETKTSHSVEVVYFAKFAEPLQNIKLNPKDHSEYKWVAESEASLIGPMSEAELVILKKGFEMLSGKPPVFG